MQELKGTTYKETTGKQDNVPSKYQYREKNYEKELIMKLEIMELKCITVMKNSLEGLGNQQKKESANLKGGQLDQQDRKSVRIKTT